MSRGGARVSFPPTPAFPLNTYRSEEPTYKLPLLFFFASYSLKRFASLFSFALLELCCKRPVTRKLQKRQKCKLSTKICELHPLDIGWFLEHGGMSRGSNNTRKWECPTGHRLEGKNVYMYRGKRGCRACRSLKRHIPRKRPPHPVLGEMGEGHPPTWLILKLLRRTFGR